MLFPFQKRLFFSPFRTAAFRAVLHKRYEKMLLVHSLDRSPASAGIFDFTGIIQINNFLCIPRFTQKLRHVPVTEGNILGITLHWNAPPGSQRNQSPL
jgi:hypothetical protein